jgi:DNA-binding transcriptional MocR family regulator
MRSRQAYSASESEQESSTTSEYGTTTRSGARTIRRAAQVEEKEDSDNSDSESEYETSQDGSDEGSNNRPGRGRRNVDPANVRRSSRTAVLAATQKTPTAATTLGRSATTPAVSASVERASLQRTLSESHLPGAAFLSAALNRRSRRSRNVDVTKELVVMMPGDDPRVMPQLDLRGMSPPTLYCCCV